MSTSDYKLSQNCLNEIKLQINQRLFEAAAFGLVNDGGDAACAEIGSFIQNHSVHGTTFLSFVVV